MDVEGNKKEDQHDGNIKNFNNVVKLTIKRINFQTDFIVPRLALVKVNRKHHILKTVTGNRADSMHTIRILKQ